MGFFIDIYIILIYIKYLNTYYNLKKNWWMETIVLPFYYLKAKYHNKGHW